MMATMVEYRRRRHAHAVVLAFAVLAAILVADPAPVDASATPVEQCFLDKINEARAAEGVAPLQWAYDIEQYTRDHSADMSGWGELIHSTGAQLNAVLADGWTIWGENIAYHSAPQFPDCTLIHNMFMDSPDHRDNLLLPQFQFVATGTYVDSNGGGWTTHVFFANPAYGYDGTFRDDDGNLFEEDIEKIAAAGITGGCGNGNFCPYSYVTRGQMAAFLNRALTLPPGPDAGFTDTAGIFKADIDAIAYDGITSGCGNNKYCPNSSLTRAQMAVFLVRALDLPPAESAGFSDTAGHPFEAQIDALAAAGITFGCGNGQYCPGGTVTRGQMAAFLSRALGL